MQPKAEMVHWMFASGVLLLGLCLLAEAVVGQEVWRMRAWRRYLWPGIAFIVHEQNPWYFARSAFLHHLLGWTFLCAAVIPLGMVFKPRAMALQSSFAFTFFVLAAMLYCDRDIAPIFGHLSPLAGIPHR